MDSLCCVVSPYFKGGPVEWENAMTRAIDRDQSAVSKILCDSYRISLIEFKHRCTISVYIHDRDRENLYADIVEKGVRVGQKSRLDRI